MLNISTRQSINELVDLITKKESPNERTEIVNMISLTGGYILLRFIIRSLIVADRMNVIRDTQALRILFGSNFGDISFFIQRMSSIRSDYSWIDGQQKEFNLQYLLDLDCSDIIPKIISLGFTINQYKLYHSFVKPRLWHSLPDPIDDKLKSSIMKSLCSFIAEDSLYDLSHTMTHIEETIKKLSLSPPTGQLRLDYLDAIRDNRRESFDQLVIQLYFVHIGWFSKKELIGDIPSNLQYWIESPPQFDTLAKCNYCY